MTMTSPWFYSLLYNGSYMLPSIILCVVVFALLYKPLKKYFTSADLLIQNKTALKKKTVDKPLKSCIIVFVLRDTAGLCKGSTADSDSVCEGSNPSPVPT